MPAVEISNKKPQVIKASIALFLFLVKLHPVWARIFPAGINTLLHVAGLAIVLVLAVLVLISSFRMIFRGHYKKPAAYIPVFILPLLLAEAWYNPLHVHLDRRIFLRRLFYGNLRNARRHPETKL